MKKHLFSFILMAMGVGMANAAEPDEGILCSYLGHVAFFPLSESPSVEYVDKEDVPYAVVLVGGAEKMSVALIDGGKLEVSYESRTLSEYTVSAKITANRQSETSDNQVVKAAEGQDGDVIVTLPAASVGKYEMAEQTVKVKFDAKGNISMVDGQTIDFTGTQDVVVTITSVTGKVADGKLNVTLEGEGSNGVGFTFVYGASTTPTHQHNYATTWSYDATNHWHACNGSVGSCDATRSGEAAHSYGNVATETSYYTCSVCKYANTTRQATYNSAVQAAADQAAAANVTNMINSIGTVVYTTECNGKITSARAAYDNLTAGQKSLVSNLQTLTDAEAEYVRLKAINKVEVTIAAIGDVEYTEEGKDECWAKIDAARQAYEALPSATDQAEVENYQTLLEAENTWNQLLSSLLKSTLVITSSKYATFVAPYAVNLPKGVTAYTIPGVESNGATLIMKEVEGKLPANTPVVIYSDEPVVKEYVLPFIMGIPQEGIMVGVLVNTDIRSGYVLQNQNDLVGFYQVSGIKTIPANHAYITQSASTEGVDEDRVKAYFFDTATAIKALAAMADGKAEIYDMNGRKQSRLQKGINIVNGVKVLVK